MQRLAGIRSYILISILLAAITTAVYWQTLGHGFIEDYDDGDYLTKNHPVRAGLTGGSVRWAFTTFRAANWHPLTWLSHMADVQIYGLKPWGHHLTNLIFHILNTLLLFLVLARMTGAVWKSGFVAALFAVHPLHVESVAWVAERKDVLSTFFWMLTMGAYVLYAERPGVLRYLPVFVFLALGLMAKPMLVTLPLALLLLDYWPLGRLRTQSNRNGLAPWKLVIEKLPLFALVLASSAVTFIAQKQGGAVGTLQHFPLGHRAGNAAVSYVSYMLKMLWPAKLAVFYPNLIGSLTAWKVAGSTVLLAAITIVAIRAARNRPFVLMGWLWYLITLVPVIGLVQVGEQAMADRYTYVTLIGLFLIAAWGVPDLFAGRRAEMPATEAPKRRGKSGRSGSESAFRVRKTAETTERATRALAGAAVLLVIALAVATWFQVGTWRSSSTLWEHALVTNPDNYLAYASLGLILKSRGELVKAEEYCTEAVRINPAYLPAHNTLGLVLTKQGRLEEAVSHFQQGLRIKPDSAELHSNLAIALSEQGKTDEALAEFNRSLQLDPNNPDAHNSLAAVLGQMGRLDEAIHHCREAIRLDPERADAYANLAIALFLKGDYSGAWNAVHRCRKYGGSPDPKLVSDLAARMPEPR